MNIKFVVVSKTDSDYIQTGINDYMSRLRHYIPFELICLPAAKDLRNATPDIVKAREATMILKQMERADRVVLLDEKGEEYTSTGFARQLQKTMNSGIRTLMFVAGGAYGFDAAVYEKAHATLSLSQMTFNHQMVRLFFAEQLYRAMTILRGEKYHNA
ncbi:MAG: 23S rRNA (pseudouridine1915-N3)-methyltransferase [bacterium P3]|nr:MAG: 23S rRNA (pseudouridine1915-N3)-methyltransferase [bacterium P3]KWW42375.1 MAG: 23S rRNA (pseudouridine1915-N3)-methyltransferase [bacterium F083]